MDALPKTSKESTSEASDDDIYKGSDEVKRDKNLYRRQQSESGGRLSNRDVLIYILIAFLFNVAFNVSMCIISKSSCDQLTSTETAIKLKSDFERIAEKFATLMKDYDTTEKQNKQLEKEKKQREQEYLELKEEKEKLKIETNELKTVISRLQHEVLFMKKNINIPMDGQKSDKRIMKMSNLFCLSQTNKHFQYGCVFGNRSLVVGQTDYVDVQLIYKLILKKHIDDDTVLFEFGFTIDGGVNKYSNEGLLLPAIRAYRCSHPFGICLDIGNETLSSLENDLLINRTENVQGKLTMKIHHSHIIFLSGQRIIRVFTIQSVSVGQSVWPVFAIYNPHLIDISLSISSENPISFNRSTVDPHLYISADNSTISNWEILAVSVTPLKFYIGIVEVVMLVLTAIVLFIETIIDGKSFEDRSILKRIFFSLIIILPFLSVPVVLYSVYACWYLYSTVLLVSFTILVLIYYAAQANMELFIFVLFTLFISAYLTAIINVSYSHLKLW